MTITRDVIQDLLPLYFAGEASADTRSLIDEYLRDNRDFAEEVRCGLEASSKMLNAASFSPPQNQEREALNRTKAVLRRRSYVLAFAIAFTLLPLSFVIDGKHISWIMLRSNPAACSLLWFLAAICWALFVMEKYKLKNSGL